MAGVAKGKVEHRQNSVADSIWDCEHGLAGRHGIVGTVIAHEHDETAQIDGYHNDKDDKRSQKLVARHGVAGPNGQSSAAGRAKSNAGNQRYARRPTRPLERLVRPGEFT